MPNTTVGSAHIRHFHYVTGTGAFLYLLSCGHCHGLSWEQEQRNRPTTPSPPEAESCRRVPVETGSWMQRTLDRTVLRAGPKSPPLQFQQ
ncbi:hypothetical protein Y1Q_0013098 [Alligator mississippiensis]|uniref:Uncharacterized protein n=1 Tax=Alligator mississippiensis TaxID=8496 RepID=A0A151NH25_ALLMI|nr:hypothetical protein Y1Q_0013098 [Alligator mississippiensis]